MTENVKPLSVAPRDERRAELLEFVAECYDEYLEQDPHTKPVFAMFTFVDINGKANIAWRPWKEIEGKVGLYHARAVLKLQGLHNSTESEPIP